MAPMTGVISAAIGISVGSVPVTNVGAAMLATATAAHRSKTEMPRLTSADLRMNARYRWQRLPRSSP